MAEHQALDYQETGSGAAIVFVPGSCSTGAAWRPVIAALGADYRCITTSLPGYGASPETRGREDPSLDGHIEGLRGVIDRAGGDVHLVGHSFGAHVALALCLRGEKRVRSLFLVEPPTPNLLLDEGRHAAYRAFRDMSESFVSTFRAGDPLAAEQVIDFYGGLGAFAAWPERLRQFVSATTPTLVRDWESAYASEITPRMLSSIETPLTLLIGRRSHPSVRLVNKIIQRSVKYSRLVDIENAAHFMIATHPRAVAERILEHLHRADLEENSLKTIDRELRD